MRRNFDLWRFSTVANDFGCVFATVWFGFGVANFVFADFTFCFATGGAGRKMQNQEKRNVQQQKRKQRKQKRFQNCFSRSKIAKNRNFDALDLSNFVFHVHSVYGCRRSGNEVRRNFWWRFLTAANDFGCVCDVVVAVFGVFDDGFAVFVDFVFSGSRHLWRRKM